MIVEKKKRRIKKGEVGNEFFLFFCFIFCIFILKVIVEFYSFYGMFIIIDVVI